MPDAVDPDHEVTVHVEFTRVWGHPTKNLIMGVGDKAFVSPYILRCLTGYVKVIGRKEERRCEHWK